MLFAFRRESAPLKRGPVMSKGSLVVSKQVLLGALLVSSSAWIAPVSAATPACDSGTAPTTFSELRVVKECTSTALDANGNPITYTTTRDAKLGDHVVVAISGLSRFRPESTSTVDWSRIVLVIDGQPLKGVTPLYSDLAHSHLEFVLTQDATNRAAWIPVL